MAKIRLSYSRQAELLIAFANVDRADFEKQFKQNIPVGSGNVLEYILLKQEEKEKKQSGK